MAEVLSAESAAVDLSFKARLYARAGIQSYWIVDPLAERFSFSQFSLGGDGVYVQLLQTDERVTVDQPWEITLDLPEWTRRRDRIRARPGPARHVTA